MSTFDTWFEQVLTTGNTGAVRLGMSPQQLMQLFGEPSYKMAPADDPNTIMQLWYSATEGTIIFDFTRQDMGSPCSGEQLRSFEESGNPKRIVSQRLYL